MRQSVVCRLLVLSGMALLASDPVATDLHASPSTRRQSRPVFRNEFDRQSLPSKIVHLPEGVHVRTVRFDASPFNFGGLLWTRTASKPQIDT